MRGDFVRGDFVRVGFCPYPTFMMEHLPSGLYGVGALGCFILWGGLRTRDTFRLSMTRATRMLHKIRISLDLFGRKLVKLQTFLLICLRLVAFAISHTATCRKPFQNLQFLNRFDDDDDDDDERMNFNVA